MAVDMKVWIYFVLVDAKYYKSRKQTLESAQNGLEIIFKATRSIHGFVVFFGSELL